MASDVELMLAWRAGDRDAGGVIIERYYRLLYRFFRNKASDVAEDLVQRTFLVCVERKDEVRDVASLRGYLLAVARSELIRHYRKSGRAEFSPLEVSIEDLEARPSSWVVRKQEHRLLQSALRRVPVDVQVLLELYYWENATAPELACVLEVPEGTVRSRIRRGRELLREQMQALAENKTMLEETLSRLDDHARAMAED